MGKAMRNFTKPSPRSSAGQISRYRRRTFRQGFLFALSLLLFVGCDSEGDDEDEQMVSRFGDTESHNAGEDCMVCHRAGGSGEGIFVVAGTVYREDLTTTHPGTIVRLLTTENRSVLLTLEVDARGNFYTTEAPGFDGGLLAEVSSESETRAMLTPVTNGACNSCHGESVPVVHVAAAPLKADYH